MASPNKITKEITLEGQSCTLAIDLNFYRRYHKLTGRDLFAGEQFTPGSEDITAMLYAALRSGKSEIVKGVTDEDGMDLVGGLVHPGNLTAVSEVLQELMKANNPRPQNGSDPLAEAPTEGSQPIG